MNGQQVFQRFCELTGLSYNDAQQYRWLCNNAADELNEMLVSNIDMQKCSSRLSVAAAAIAYYRYIIFTENSNVTSFKAGDLTVAYSDCKVFAKEYLNQCLKSIAPYIKDGNFMFRGVRVDKKDNHRCN